MKKKNNVEQVFNDNTRLVCKYCGGSNVVGNGMMHYYYCIDCDRPTDLIEIRDFLNSPKELTNEIKPVDNGVDKHIPVEPISESNVSDGKTKSQSGKREYSKNERAEKIVGKRLTDGIIIDFPCELGYHCPVCEYEQIKDGNYDERLDWSEYEGFIYCHKCNKDYPSCLCMPDKEKATKIYLDCIESKLSESKKECTAEERAKRLSELNSLYEHSTEFVDTEEKTYKLIMSLRSDLRNKIECLKKLV